MLSWGPKSTLPEINNLDDFEQVLRDIDTPDVSTYPHNGGRFEVCSAEVRFVDGEGKGTKVCDELRIEAWTRNARGECWGILLKWNDPDGLPHTWSMPVELLHGETSELLKELGSRGLRIRPGQGKRLRDYLLGSEVGARVRCVDKVGWHGDVYCTPAETIGTARGERIVFQGAGSIMSEHARSGSLERWRDTVAALAAGNSRLIFAIAVAFAGPLLELVGGESGGFHLMGASSTGKTTALRLAASVWGNPDRYIRQWRATANGLEGLAAVHNDGLLILDELSQCDGKQAGEVAYMLANGKGKARASRSGSAREAASWRLLFLSSGEVSLSTLIEGAGRRANAGQENRLANVAADAGAGFGMFEVLHGRKSAPEFADQLREACTSAHGVVGREWLARIVQDRVALSDEIPHLARKFVDEVVPSGASGQVQRVATRFGLVAAAGEIATAFGLTGWQDGDAANGVGACFGAWMEDYGTGSREDRAIVEQVRLFIEKHGNSRFQKIDAEDERVLNQAGYWRDERGIRQFLVTSAVFKSDVVSGFDSRGAAKVLQAHGMLVTEGDRLTKTVRVPGHGSKRVYCIVLTQEVAA